MIEILSYKKSRNAIVTIAIGEESMMNWNKVCKDNWINYCNKHELGLYVITEHLINEENNYWKKPTWQKMLIGDFFLIKGIDVNNLCYLDTDILISPFAPNVFNFFNDENKIALVSLFNRIPFDVFRTRKLISYYRRMYIDIEYPLDSVIHMNIKDIYEYHSLAVKEDFACAGFFIFNVGISSEKMKSWFFKYPKNIRSITNGGDQTHFNFEVLTNSEVQWLPYEFQAIWNFELANNYPFLYKNGLGTSLINECINSTLSKVWFLHFAGSWFESKMIHNFKIIPDYFLNDLQIYLESEIKIKQYGTLKQ